MRRLVAETSLQSSQLVMPLFVAEGLERRAEIPSMPGQFQHSEESLLDEVAACVRAGVGGVLLFAVPATKDETGSGAYDDEGIAQRALRALSAQFADQIVIMSDLCLDEYTSHGHCGVLAPDGSVDNDATLPLYVATAIAQARAGSAVVAPSGMMDGQVGALRRGLDEAGFTSTAILAYSAKYASALYGPFRDAVGVEIAGGGTRAAYQQDPRNAREARREIRLDFEEGADMVMVKPALAYLDIIAEARQSVDVPFGRLPRQWGVLHGRGRQRAGLARSARDGPRTSHGDPSGRGRHRHLLLRPRDC
jgi:porphobilinogen synthase